MKMRRDFVERWAKAVGYHLLAWGPLYALVTIVLCILGALL